MLIALLVTLITYSTTPCSYELPNPTIETERGQHSAITYWLLKEHTAGLISMCVCVCVCVCVCSDLSLQKFFYAMT